MSAYSFTCTPGLHVLDVDELPRDRWLPNGWRSIGPTTGPHQGWVLACEEHDPDRVAETAVHEIVRLVEEEYAGGALTPDALLRAIARITNGYLGG